MTGLFDDLLPATPGAAPPGVPAPPPPQSGASPAPQRATPDLFGDLYRGEAAPAAAPQQQRPNGIAAFANSVSDAMTSGAQGTSPVVRSMDGVQYYEPADQQAQGFYDEMGYAQHRDRQVVLRDPDTGKMRVYLRNPNMEEHPLISLGRLSGFGSPLTVGPVAAWGQGPRALMLDFDRARVPPSVPAVSDSSFSKLLQKFVGTLPFIGPMVQERADQMQQATAGGVERVANSLGDVRAPRDVGNTVDQGIERFNNGNPDAIGPPMPPAQVIASPTRATSFSEKAAALYDRFNSFFNPTDMIDMSGSLRALRGPVDRFPNAPTLGQDITNSRLQRWADIIDQAGGRLSMAEARELRGQVGRMMGPDRRLHDIPQADLRNLYGALSQDMRTAAEARGPDALKAFTRADQYYTAGLDRINTVDDLVKGHPEGTYAAINSAAGTGSSADAGRLTQLQRTLQPEEWGQVAATLTERLGTPTPGAVDRLGATPNFSMSSFMTNAARLSPDARDLMWGPKGTSLRDEMESLLNVGQTQKNIDKFTNWSGSAEHGKVAGLAAALYNKPVFTLLSFAGGSVAGRAMMNPRFVKWLYGAQQSVRPAQITGSLGQLDLIARTDPDLKDVADGLKSAWAKSDFSTEGLDRYAGPAQGQQAGADAPVIRMGDLNPGNAVNTGSPQYQRPGLLGQGGYPGWGPWQPPPPQPPRPPVDPQAAAQATAQQMEEVRNRPPVVDQGVRGSPPFPPGTFPPVSVGPFNPAAMLNIAPPGDPRLGLLRQGGYPSPLLRPR